MPKLPAKIIFILLFCLLSYPCFAEEPPRYEIDAQLDTLKRTISASQKVTFTNNSPQEVNEIYFHIYPHRKYTEKEIRFIYRYAGYFKINPFPEGFQSGDLKITAVSSASGGALTYNIEGKDQTILKVNLETALKPGESREIRLQFTVEIPHAYGRFGWHKGVFTLVRWYPILSVLDKNGWHNYPFYLYHLPHFSEASYYKVTLTLPAEQSVASSGTLKSEQDNPDATRTLSLETEFPVRDFSLGISDKFLIYTLKDDSLKINAYYLTGNEAAARRAAESARELIKFYAGRFGAYPYREFNIVPSFLGYGGVQTSAQVFIDTRVYRLPGFLSRFFDFLISHETGHQWFYNLVGSDEYKEMFLDEGINSYWLLRHLEAKYGQNALVMELPKFLKWLIPNFSFRDSSIARYIYLAKNGLDRPIISELSSFQEPSSIFALTYGKGAAVLGMLEGLIGEEKFLKIMQRYTSEFRFKNISLDELIRICNQESGEHLDEFFTKWLKTKQTCDYAVKSVNRDKIILENRGTLSMPPETKIIYTDGTEELDQWQGNDKQREIILGGDKKVKQVIVDPDNAIGLDLDTTNNYWPRNLSIRPVPLYFFAYEIPVFLPRNSRNLVLGPTLGGSSIGLASSLQKPYDGTLRLSYDYDFSGKAHESKLGYEFNHLSGQQLSLGFELFDYETSKAKQDVSGGKIYLRQELWPASYGLFDLNDHVTLYFVRDQRMDNAGLAGQEDINNLHYRKKDEAIIGLTGSLGRYGPYADPCYGWKFMPTQEFAGHFLGGNESFWRTSFELDNYRLILPKYQHKLATKLKFGWGESSDKSLFYLGGPDGLRGYSRKTVKGAHMLLGSLEYRLPLKSEVKWYFLDNVLCLDKIQMVGFFDAAKAWYADFRGDDFKKDVGLGLRLHFEVMGLLENLVLRLDVARALNDPKEDTHTWFGLSHAF